MVKHAACKRFQMHEWLLLQQTPETTNGDRADNIVTFHCKRRGLPHFHSSPMSKDIFLRVVYIIVSQLKSEEQKQILATRSRNFVQRFAAGSYANSVSTWLSVLNDWKPRFPSGTASDHQPKTGIFLFMKWRIKVSSNPFGAADQSITYDNLMDCLISSKYQ